MIYSAGRLLFLLVSLAEATGTSRPGSQKPRGRPKSEGVQRAELTSAASQRAQQLQNTTAGQEDQATSSRQPVHSQNEQQAGVESEQREESIRRQLSLKRAKSVEASRRLRLKKSFVGVARSERLPPKYHRNTLEVMQEGLSSNVNVLEKGAARSHREPALSKLSTLGLKSSDRLPDKASKMSEFELKARVEAGRVGEIRHEITQTIAASRAEAQRKNREAQRMSYHKRKVLNVPKGQRMPTEWRRKSLKKILQKEGGVKPGEEQDVAPLATFPPVRSHSRAAPLQIREAEDWEKAARYAAENKVKPGREQNHSRRDHYPPIRSHSRAAPLQIRETEDWERAARYAAENRSKPVEGKGKGVLIVGQRKGKQAIGQGGPSAPQPTSSTETY